MRTTKRQVAELVSEVAEATRRGTLVAPQVSGYAQTDHVGHARLMRLSNARSEWGSCNARGEIRLSWRLVPAAARRWPSTSVAHEVAHLVELNHSAALLGDRRVADARTCGAAPGAGRLDGVAWRREQREGLARAGIEQGESQARPTLRLRYATVKEAEAA